MLTIENCVPLISTPCAEEKFSLGGAISRASRCALIPCGAVSPNKTQMILEELTMFEKLKELLVDELQIDEADITLDAELSGDLGINSIDLADLVLLCEEKFDIEIDDESLHKLVTVGDVVSYLESL